VVRRSECSSADRATKVLAVPGAVGVCVAPVDERDGIVVLACEPVGPTLRVEGRIPRAICGLPGRRWIRGKELLVSEHRDLRLADAIGAAHRHDARHALRAARAFAAHAIASRTVAAGAARKTVGTQWTDAATAIDVGLRSIFHSIDARGGRARAR